MHGLSLLPFYLAELMSYAMALGAGYLCWRLVRAYERRAAQPACVAALDERLQMLEETVERMESTVVHMVDAQQFTSRLLLDRGTSDQRQSARPGGGQ